jgi:transposase InsO family protein
MVQPATVIGWHRKLAAYLHTLKSQKYKTKRFTPQEVKQLVIQMDSDNPLWGAEKIRGALLNLGIRRAKLTIQRILEPNKRPTPPKVTQNWRTFLKNHAPHIWATDYFTVTTAAFKQLYVMVVLHIETRKIVHWNVTDHPTAQWSYHQILQATWDNQPPRYLICDRDSKFANEFSENVEKRLNIEIIRTPYRSPKANSFAERLVGTLRRECLDHFIPFGQSHLRSILAEFIEYYNRFRPHQGINQQIPIQFGSLPDPPSLTQPIGCKPILNGLHHRYYREAA